MKSKHQGSVLCGAGTVSTDVDGLDVIKDTIPVFPMKGPGVGN